MTETYALPEDIEQKTGYTDDTTTDVDLQEVLEEAHRDMESQVGKNLTETVYINETLLDGTLPTEYFLDLKPVLKVDKVRYGNRRIPAEDYTLEKQKGGIDFAQTIIDDYFQYKGSFEVEYVPKAMKDLEVWIAVTILRNQEVIQVDDDQIKAQVKNSERKAAKLRNALNRKRVTGTFTDGKVNRFTP